MTEGGTGSCRAPFDLNEVSALLYTRQSAQCNRTPTRGSLAAERQWACLELLQRGWTQKSPESCVSRLLTRGFSVKGQPLKGQGPCG